MLKIHGIYDTHGNIKLWYKTRKSNRHGKIRGNVLLLEMRKKKENSMIERRKNTVSQWKT